MIIFGDRILPNRTLFRYIINEATISFLVSFLFFFFIFFVNQLLLMAEEILSKHAPPDQVALLVLFSIPAIVAMATPFASLVGILMAIGRMTSDNEILVMRASGLPYRTLFIPILFFGVIISVISFFANDVLLPAGTLEFGKLYRRLLLSTPELELESNSVKRYKDTVIVTGAVENKEIQDLLIFDKTENGERRLIVAGTAGLESGEGAALSLNLTEAFIHSIKENERTDYDYAITEKLAYTIMQTDLVQAIGAPGPREMSSTDVARQIELKRQTLAAKREIRRQEALASALLLETALRSGPNKSTWNTVKSQTEKLSKTLIMLQESNEDRSLRVYRLEYYKKFSIPFGALSFAILATPLGLFARKSGQSVGFGLGLIIAVAYWALLIGGQTLGVRLGYSPFWAMWLPNTIIVITGVLLSAYRFRR